MRISCVAGRQTLGGATDMSTREIVPAADAFAATAVRDPRLLDVAHIVKRFPTPEGTITAVDDVSFAIAAGQFVSIIGPSGCGKSTLFNIIGGLAGDYEGRVTVGGDTIKGTHPAI